MGHFGLYGSDCSGWWVDGTSYQGEVVEAVETKSAIALVKRHLAGTWIGQVYRDMGQSRAGDTGVDGTCRAEGPDCAQNVSKTLFK